MEKIELVCVICQRADRGDGVWLEGRSPTMGEPQNRLCPECCRKRFPQFYADYQKPAKYRLKIKNLLSALIRIAASGNAWPML